jgi:tRNA 2-thiouridine synthesizing protein B
MLVLIKYGCENKAESWKMDMANENDAIVLVQNGVFWAISEEIDPYLEKNLNVVALEPDFAARGYTEEDSKVPLISYDDLVSIIEAQPKSMG